MYLSFVKMLTGIYCIAQYYKKTSKPVIIFQVVKLIRRTNRTTNNLVNGKEPAYLYDFVSFLLPSKPSRMRLTLSKILKPVNPKKFGLAQCES